MSNFNPQDFGATEVSNFNPVNFKATPISSSVPDPEKDVSLAEKIWRGLSGVVSSVEQPFISLAAKPVQLAAKVAGIPDPYAEGFPAGLPGGSSPAKVTPPTLKGTTGDILKAGSEMATVAAAPATIPAAIATGAGIGAASLGGQALQEDKSLSDAAKQAAIGATIGGVTAGAIAGLGKLVGAVGEKIQNSVIKPSRADIQDGFSIDTIKKYDLGGSLKTVADKTESKLSQLTNELNAKLVESPTKIDLNQVYQNTVKELTDSSKLRGFGANTQILSGLDKLKNEVSIVAENGQLSIPDAQLVKQASGSYGAWQFGRVDPESKANEIIFNTFYNKLKTAIEDASPEGVKSLNQQLGELIPVMNAVIRRLPVAERSNLISLNDMIGLVGSSISNVALGPTLLGLLSRSGTAANLFMKASAPITSAAIPAAGVTAPLAGQVLNTSQ